MYSKALVASIFSGLVSSILIAPSYPSIPSIPSIPPYSAYCPNNIKAASLMLVGKQLVTSGYPSYSINTVQESSLPKPYRILKKDSIITMDYVETRLNVYISDYNNMITKVTCG